VQNQNTSHLGMEQMESNKYVACCSSTGGWPCKIRAAKSTQRHLTQAVQPWSLLYGLFWCYVFLCCLLSSRLIRIRMTVCLDFVLPPYIVYSFILHYQVLFSSLYLCSIWPSCDGAFLGQAASKLVRQWPLWRKLDRDSLHWEPGHVDVSICNIYVYISPRTFFLNRRWQIVLLLFSFDGCLMFCRKLGNLELSGTLSGDIQFVQELQHLYVNSSLGSLST